jgi:hypothetical protein
MSGRRRYAVTCDRTRTDGSWLLEDMHEIRDLGLADLVLVWLIYRATGIPFSITRDTDPREEAAA